MAIIVSSTIISVSPQIDGTRDIIEEHICILNKKYIINYNAHPIVDINVQLLARVPFLESALIEQDLNDVIFQIQTGIDPLNVVVKYCTKAQAVKKLLRWFITHRAWDVWLIIPLIDSLTDLQLKNFLGITQAKADIIRARVISLKVIKISINSDDTLVEVG